VTRRSGWTLWTLAEHTERRHEDLVRMLDERFETQNMSNAAALASMNERLAAHNDLLRAWQADRAITPTRSEIDARLKPLEASGSTEEGHRAGATEARTGLRLDSGWLLVLIGTVAAIIIGFTR
jgi:hypothetical protein